jgi:hypothetical protein
LNKPLPDGSPDSIPSPLSPSCEEGPAEDVSTHLRISTLLLVVADSWDRLRACDLDRLIEAAEDSNILAELIDAVRLERPDLLSLALELGSLERP